MGSFAQVGLLSVMKKVLFIHHGGVAGGAPLSLLYTALGVRDRGFIPAVALLAPSKELHYLYNSHGIATHEVPYIPFFIVWSSYSPSSFSLNCIRDVLRAAFRWKKSQSRIYRFVKENKFDLVHLNSVGLSNVAQVLLKHNFPFVWHIREQGPEQKGLRYQFIHNSLAKSRNIIFLSGAEKKSWGFIEHGNVIHNFIDFTQFNFKENDNRNHYRKEFGIEENDFVILFLGGLKQHKGTELLIRASKLVMGKYPNIKLLMPDSLKQPLSSGNDSFIYKILVLIKRHLLRKIDYSDHILSLIDELKMSNNCIRLGFDPDSVPFFACSDIVVFPAIQPHFARPIIEAYAMKKPVIASNFDVMNELVQNSKTGYLFEPGNVVEFSNYIEMLVNSPALRDTMAEQGFVKAKNEFGSDMQIKKIIKVYLSALGSEVHQVSP